MKRIDQEKLLRRCLRKAYNMGVPKEVRPLTEHPRNAADRDDWDSYTEYGFLRGKDYTDDEVREVLDDMRLRVTSPYDCSGQRFTLWITWHRNPSGLISYCHRIGIDV